jgi:hypothetical protein
VLLLGRARSRSWAARMRDYSLSKPYDALFTVNS